MHHEQIFNVLFNKDEITWQGMIYDLVRSEEMDPWDVDIKLLSKGFLKRLKNMKEMDLRISGKVILASAMLLKMKSNRLMEEDINGLDTLIASMQALNDEDGFEDLVDFESADGSIMSNQNPRIYPKTPQPRKRKVSVFDLVNALDKALHVHARRTPIVNESPEVRIPDKPRDISLVIKDVYKQITHYFSKTANNAAKLTLQNLLPSKEKIDAVYTFVPLLHLDNQRKIDLIQEHHFGDIEIKLLKGNIAG